MPEDAMPDNPTPENTAPENSLTVTCACGWETSGDEDTVVAATQAHGAALHNMDATRDDVLAMARPTA